MLNCARLWIRPVQALSDQLLAINNAVQQQSRSVYILERTYPLRLHKKSHPPKKFKSRNYIYRLVENTNLKPSTLVDVVLTESIEGLGEVGDKLSLKPFFVHKNLLLPKKAVYATPENIAKYCGNEKREKKYSSLLSPTTVKLLSTLRLGVGMSAQTPWELEKWHVRVHFRLQGVAITDESITLPEKPIVGPNLENEGNEFYVTVTINKKEQVNVRCALFHYFEPNQSPFPENYWQYPGDPIYPEFEEILNSLPKDYPLMNKDRPEVKLKDTNFDD